MGRQAKIATFIGLGLAALGFLLVAISWNRASDLDFVQGQFPYLLSGGLTGIGLVVVGLGIIVIQQLREDAAQRSRQLEQLNGTVSALVTLLAPPDEYDPVVAGEFRPRPRASSNGQEGEPATATTSTWEPPPAP